MASSPCSSSRSASMAAKWLLAIGVGGLAARARRGTSMTSDPLLGKHEAYARRRRRRESAGADADRGADQRDRRLGGGAGRVQGDAGGDRSESVRRPHQRLSATPSCSTASINVYFQTWFLYRFFFDIFGMMLIGMALFRMGVLTLRAADAALSGDARAGYGIGLTVNVPGDALDPRPPVQRALVRAGQYQLRSRPAGDDDRPSRRAAAVRALGTLCPGFAAPSPRSGRWR